MFKLIKQEISKGDLISSTVVAEFETRYEAEKYYRRNIAGKDPDEGFRWSDWNEYQIIEE